MARSLREQIAADKVAFDAMPEKTRRLCERELAAAIGEYRLTKDKDTD